mmetsp:Transcript_42170/g.68311  ORF Transcript_42170/g.68311 Transcript_42170/m.68311 type:complete len:288 (+) Transcript_42170:1157-2020(+)
MSLGCKVVLQACRAHPRARVTWIAPQSDEGPLHQRSPLRTQLPVQQVQELRDDKLAAVGCGAAGLENRRLLCVTEGDARFLAGLAKLVDVQLVVHVVIGGVEVLDDANRCSEALIRNLRPCPQKHIIDARVHVHLVMCRARGQGVGLPMVKPSTRLRGRSGRRPRQGGTGLDRGVGDFVQVPHFLQGGAKLLIGDETTADCLVVVLKLLPCNQVGGVRAHSATEADVLLERRRELVEHSLGTAAAVGYLWVAIRIEGRYYLGDVHQPLGPGVQPSEGLADDGPSLGA